MLRLALLAAAAILTHHAMAQVAGGKITGVVLNSVTGKGVAFAKVDARQLGSESRFEVEADERGAFVIEKCLLEDYHLSARAPGFLTFVPRYQPQPIARATLTRQEPTAAVRISLIPGATIAGRVWGADGKPRAAVKVRAMPVERDLRDGGLRSMGYSASTISSALGEYQLSGLPQARYWVLTDLRSALPRAEALNASQATMEFFHPSALEPAEATVLNVERGTALTGIDLRLRTVRGVRVAGVVRSALLRDTQGVVSLSNREPPDYWSDQPYTRTGAGGGFEFAGVPPGDYDLHVQFLEAPDVRARTTARIALRVDNVDRTGLVIEPSKPFTLKAEVDWGGARVNWRQLRVPFEEADSDSRSAAFTFDDAGSLRAEDVRAGEYRLTQRSGYGDCYIKSAFLDGRNVLSGAFAIAGSGANLRLAMACDGGGVTGQIDFPDGLRQADSLVALWPTEGGAGQANLIYVVRGDGPRFRLAGVVPGEYKALAFRRRTTSSLPGFALLNRWAAKAASITIRPGKTESLMVNFVDLDE